MLRGIVSILYKDSLQYSRPFCPGSDWQPALRDAYFHTVIWFHLPIDTLRQVSLAPMF